MGPVQGPDEHTGRACHALAVLFGELHAIGGRNGKTSVEKYNLRADCWSAVPEMTLPGSPELQVQWDRCERAAALRLMT